MRIVTIVAVAVLLSAGPLLAQERGGKAGAVPDPARRSAGAKAGYVAPRTADGQPDLQGTWVSRE